MPAIDKARLYRGKGGEIMREGVSKLVAALAQVRMERAWENEGYGRACHSVLYMACIFFVRNFGLIKEYEAETAGEDS